MSNTEDKSKIPPDMEILYRQALRHIQKLNKDIKVDTVDLRKAIEDTEKLTNCKCEVCNCCELKPMLCECDPGHL